MRLNLGSGEAHRTGYVSVDVRPLPGVTLLLDARTMPSINTDSCEEIMAQDILEHFPRADTLAALREWYRVLAPGGKLWMRFPDLKRTCERYLGVNIDPVLKIDANTASMLLYGAQDHQNNFHYAIWDRESITELLVQIGYVNITCENDEGSNLVVECYKPKPEEPKP